MLTLGQLISKKREDLGYKKMQLSRLLDVGDDTLRSWERDRFVPAGKNMRAIIDVLRFTPQECSLYFKGWQYG